MKTRYVLASFALLATAVQAETFRCGKWIASVDLSLPELLAKCGEPAARTTRTQDVMVRNLNTGLMEKSGETTIEVWTYERGSTSPAILVTVVDGRIKSIERRK